MAQNTNCDECIRKAELSERDDPTIIVSAFAAYLHEDHAIRQAARQDPLVDAALLEDDAVAAMNRWINSPQAKSDWRPNIETGRAISHREMKATYRRIVEMIAAGVSLRLSDGSWFDPVSMGDEAISRIVAQSRSLVR